MNVHVEVELAEGQLIRSSLLKKGQSFSWKLSEPCLELEAWLEAYRAGKPLPLPQLFDLSHLSPFASDILEACAEIPFGTTLTYGALARSAGYRTTAARAVGRVMGMNPLPLFIPCHRVVASTGLGGFSQGPGLKEAMLAFEGR